MISVTAWGKTAGKAFLGTFLRPFVLKKKKTFYLFTVLDNIFSQFFFFFFKIEIL